MKGLKFQRFFPKTNMSQKQHKPNVEKWEDCKYKKMGIGGVNMRKVVCMEPGW